VKANDIESMYVALDDDGRARPLPVDADFWPALIEGRLGKISRLVSSYTFTTDWNTWEKHPAGEEFACLLEGDVEFVLEQNGGESVVRLNAPGSFVLVPRDTWHTARVHKPSRMLFLTAGEGTSNKPV